MTAKQPYRSVWNRDIWQQVKKQPRQMNVAWVKNAQGTSSPVEPVVIAGQKYYRATLCEPHNCGHQMFVLMNNKRAAALRLADVNLFYGVYDEDLRDYLSRWRAADEQGKPF